MVTLCTGLLVENVHVHNTARVGTTRGDENVVARRFPQVSHERHVVKTGVHRSQASLKPTIPVIITRKGSRRKKINVVYGSHTNGPGETTAGGADTIAARLASW